MIARAVDKSKTEIWEIQQATFFKIFPQYGQPKLYFLLKHQADCIAELLEYYGKDADDILIEAKRLVEESLQSPSESCGAVPSDTYIKTNKGETEMTNTEMMNQLLGNENAKRIKASRVALIEEAIKAGIGQAVAYMEGADYKQMLLVTQISPDEDGRYYSELEEITYWDMSGTLEDFPESMHRHVEHGFVQHVTSVVSLIEASDMVEYSSNLVARMEKELAADEARYE